MTLAAFQRALTDLTASPEMCRFVRHDPDWLMESYDLTARERDRLAGIAASAGMEANCILYRANRLAPVALNCPDLCDALGEELNRLISAYWEAEPTTNVHFLVETERFCAFLAGRADLTPSARAALAREHDIVLQKLAASAVHADRDAFGRTRSPLNPR